MGPYRAKVAVHLMLLSSASFHLQEQRPDQIGSIDRFAIHPSGRIAFDVHSMRQEEPQFLLREVGIKE